MLARLAKIITERASTSGLTCKELGSYLIFIIEKKKRLNKLEISDFSCTHQRPEVARHTATLKFGQTGKQRIATEIS